MGSGMGYVWGPEGTTRVMGGMEDCGGHRGGYGGYGGTGAMGSGRGRYMGTESMGAIRAIRAR